MKIRESAGKGSQKAQESLKISEKGEKMAKKMKSEAVSLENGCMLSNLVSKVKSQKKVVKSTEKGQKAMDEDMKMAGAVDEYLDKSEENGDRGGSMSSDLAEKVAKAWKVKVDELKDAILYRGIEEGWLSQEIFV